jgi:hypothetical protein
MKLKITGTCIIAVFALVFCFSANANQITFAETIFNTNFVTSDIGLRGVGAGDLTVSGVSGTVTQSLLFWHGPTNSSDPNANANVTVGGKSVTGTNIGFSQDNFWASQNSQAYRADVTSIVTGNGTVALSNFQKPNAQVNGAALFTFFNTGLSTGKRDVVLFEGNDSNFASSFDPAGWDATLSGIKYSGGSAFLTMYVSDGQDFSATDDGTLRVNGTPIATGGIFQGSSAKAPGAGVSNGSLTDVETFDITSLLTLGPNSLHITLDAGFDDALSAVVFAIDLPAGDAPPPPGMPEPSSLALLSLGLVVLCAWHMRRMRSASAN